MAEVLVLVDHVDGAVANHPGAADWPSATVGGVPGRRRERHTGPWRKFGAAIYVVDAVLGELPGRPKARTLDPDRAGVPRPPGS